MVVGLLCALKSGHNAEIPLIYVALGGMAIGSVAGCSILLLDPASDPTSGQRLEGDAKAAVNQSGIVGRFLAISGLLLCWTPFLGVVLNLIGLAVNWRSSDWARSVSKYSAIVGFVATTIVFGLTVLIDG